MFFVWPVAAQKTLYLRPDIGLGLTTNHLISAPQDNNFRYNIFPTNIVFGLNLQLQINEKLGIYTGWKYADTGYGFGIRTNQGLVGQRHSIGSTTQRISLGFQKDLRTIKLGKRNKRKELLKNTNYNNQDLLYLILFKLKLMGGLTADYTNLSTDEGIPIIYNGSTAYVEHCFTVDQRWGGSVFMGLNLQFFNYEKDRLQLTIFYSQGFNNKYNINVDYIRKDGRDEYHAVLGSRGSYFGIQVGYPIKLITFNTRD